MQAQQYAVKHPVKVWGWGLWASNGQVMNGLAGQTTYHRCHIYQYDAMQGCLRGRVWKLLGKGIFFARRQVLLWRRGLLSSRIGLD